MVERSLTCERYADRYLVFPFFKNFRGFKDKTWLFFFMFLNIYNLVILNMTNRKKYDDKLIIKEAINVFCFPVLVIL